MNTEADEYIMFDNVTNDGHVYDFLSLTQKNVIFIHASWELIFTKQIEKNMIYDLN